MLAQELYDYYGSWSELVRKLELGLTCHANWRKIGYIPYKTQLLIEKKTDGLFKSDLAHARPEKKHNASLSSN